MLINTQPVNTASRMTTSCSMLRIFWMSMFFCDILSDFVFRNIETVCSTTSEMDCAGTWSAPVSFCFLTSISIHYQNTIVCFKTSVPVLSRIAQILSEII